MLDQLIHFPPEQVIEVNNTILDNGRGLRGGVNHAALEGALARIDNAILYNGLDDVFSISAKYAKAILMRKGTPSDVGGRGISPGRQPRWF